MTTSNLIRRRVDLLRTGEFLRSSDFSKHPRAAVDSALSRRARRGADLVRVRNGLYWKGAASRFGPGRPDEADAALAAAGPGAGPSGVSAANALGLSAQVAAVPSFAVTGRRPTGLRGVRLVSRSNHARRSATPFEIAVLEVLREYPLHVESSWEQLVERLREEAARGRIRIGTVLRVAACERNPALRMRAAALRDALMPASPPRRKRT